MIIEFTTQAFFDQSDLVVLGQVESGAVHFNGEASLQVAINWLMNPVGAKTSKFWQSPVGQHMINQHRLVGSEFVRKFVDNRFPYYQMPRQWKKEQKDFIRVEAKLWGHTWDAIRLLPPIPVGSVKPNPASILFRIINEHALLSYNFYERSSEEDNPTGTGFVRNHQTCNQHLRSLRNPFDQNRSPETWTFIENCLLESKRNDNFQQNHYVKMVDTRMTLMTVQNKLKSRLHNGQGIPERRGRRSKEAKINRCF